MAQNLSLSSTATLNNGVEMPRLGLGVWQMRSGRETRNAVRAALEIGYRLIDTAAAYGNERDVGEAIRRSGIPREEVFVTTKLWNSDQGYEPALRAFRRSLRTLGLDYVDLYLIHWPVPELRLESWRALERILTEGRTEAIGVSNFTVPHLRELREVSPTAPAVNQVELHPFLTQQELRAFCPKHAIQLEAYTPLTRGERLDDPLLARLARAYGKTPAQILIRWSLQRGLVVIPKSSKRERIAENADVFDFGIEAADMDALDALDESLHVCWDPTTIDEAPPGGDR
jgi:diketogulonate reductase-like aldo/keto reductase